MSILAFVEPDVCTGVCTASSAGYFSASMAASTSRDELAACVQLASRRARVAPAYSAGDRFPVGVEAFPGREPNDVVLWIEDRRAAIAGDTLVDLSQGLEIPVEWLRQGVTRELPLADALADPGRLTHARTKRRERAADNLLTTRATAERVSPAVSSRP